MKKTFITDNSEQTRKLGERLASELRGGKIICLTGELGSGKTTFSQGVLRGLGAKEPYTSPTFVVMKQYKLKAQNLKRKATVKSSKLSENKIEKVFHLDCYRVNAEDIMNLGWEEIISSKNNIVIVEWAERIEQIVPKKAMWIKFGHKGKNEREIMIC